MCMFTRRTQLLLDEERYGRLERRAAEAGTSVASLIREAIDVAFPEVVTDRERAGDAILSAEPMPVDDWPVMKQEIAEISERALSPAPSDG